MWLREFFRELGDLSRHGRDHVVKLRRFNQSHEHRLVKWMLIFAGAAIVTTLLVVGLRKPTQFVVTSVDMERKAEFRIHETDYTLPVRKRPKTFKRNLHLPNMSESMASGPLGFYPFDPKEDLIRVEDSRVWWESDNNEASGDTEDDHIMHRAVEKPLRRLIELLGQRNGRLKIQDAYRAEGIHAAKSLHKEGRALDLTSEEIGMSDLAKFCWAAGFDWVYYETKGGAHVHASVKSD